MVARCAPQFDGICNRFSLAEVHDTQAASLLLNLQASYTSERFVWVDGWAAMHYGRQLLGEQDCIWAATEVPTGMQGEETESDDDDDVAEIGAETEWLRKKKELEGDGVELTGRGKTYMVDGAVQVVTMAEHYRLRGVGLERFSYQEYEACITIVQKTDGQRDWFVDHVVNDDKANMEEQRRRGRRANRFVRHATTCVE